MGGTYPVPQIYQSERNRIMAYIFGIDVSKWQGDFNFQAAAGEGVQFAVLRGAYSTGKDARFDQYYPAAGAAGLSRGVYQYCMATTTDAAREEAAFLYNNILLGRQFDLPIYLDVEDSTLRALGKRKLTDVVKAWCDYLEQRNFWVGIYSSTSFFATNLYDAELYRYAHWVAQWARQCTYTPSSLLGMWQFGGETNLLRPNTVAGVVCDQDYMIEDYPAMIRAAGKNGYAASADVDNAGGYPLTGVNVGRSSNALVLYTWEYTKTNRYGFEVGIDKNGIALSDPIYGEGNMRTPERGFVLSGHGAAGDWLYGHVKENYRVCIQGSRVVPTPGIWRTLNGVNTGRDTDTLILYNQGGSTHTNPYGFEVGVDADGNALEKPVYGVGDMAIPSGGFVLSGHGTAGNWLYEKVSTGTKITFDPVTKVIQIG